MVRQHDVAGRLGADGVVRPVAALSQFLLERGCDKRGDHLNAVGGHELFVERVTVVAAVADQTRREVREEAGVKGSGDEVRLIR